MTNPPPFFAISSQLIAVGITTLIATSAMAVDFKSNESLISNDYKNTLNSSTKAITKSSAAIQANTKAKADASRPAGSGVYKTDSHPSVRYNTILNSGTAEERYQLAVTYHNSKDYSKAMRLYRIAADQLNLYAQYNIAVMYQNGDGVLKDDKAAKRWYLMSCEGGLELGCDMYATFK